LLLPICWNFPFSFKYLVAAVDVKLYGPMCFFEKHIDLFIILNNIRRNSKSNKKCKHDLGSHIATTTIQAEGTPTHTLELVLLH
jgi:hypothetical protein